MEMHQLFPTLIDLPSKLKLDASPVSLPRSRVAVNRERYPTPFPPSLYFFRCDSSNIHTISHSLPVFSTRQLHSMMLNVVVCVGIKLKFTHMPSIAPIERVLCTCVCVSRKLVSNECFENVCYTFCRTVNTTCSI